MKSRKTERYRTGVIIIAVLAFLVRICYYYFFMNYSNQNGLTGGYLINANSLLSGKNVFMTTSQLTGEYVLETIHPKGYPVLLAAAKLLAGEHYWVLIHIIQAAADASVCVFLSRICNQLFKNSRIGLIAAVVWCILPPAISNSVQELPDAFSSFLMAWLLFSYYREYSSAMKRNVTLGIMLGVAQYFRPEFMYLFVIVLFADFLRKLPLKQLLQEVFAVLLMILAIDSPWLLYSWKVSGSPSFSSTTAWGSAYEGIGFGSFNPDHIVPDDLWVTQKAIDNGYDGAWSKEGNEYYRKLVFEYIEKYPVQYLQLVVSRLPSAFEPTNRIGINLNRPGSWPPMLIGEAEEKNSSYFNNHVKSELDRSRYSLVIQADAAVLFTENLMPLLSEGLLLCMIAFIILHWKKRRNYLFLYMCWFVIPFAICFLKDIESRNVGITLVPLSVALSFLIFDLLFRSESDCVLLADQKRAVSC